MEKLAKKSRSEAIRALGDMTPSAYIARMYAQTDAESMLVVPMWGANAYCHPVPRLCFRNRMRWTEADRDRMMVVCNVQLGALKELSKLRGRLSDSEEENAKILSPDLLDVWRAYLRPFDCSAFDRERIKDIAARTGIVQEIEDIRLREELGHSMNDIDFGFLRENEDVSVEPDEAAYCAAYENARKAQAEARVGKSPLASELVACAKNLYRLLCEGAKEDALRYEAIRFAQTMVLHSCSETVSWTERAA